MPTGTSDKVQVYLARYEYEPCQIILRSSSDQSVQVNMMSADNQNQTNNTLNAELFYVDYVPITTVTDEGIGARTGDTPDVIYPANFSNSFSLKQNQNFPLWILFNASVNATAGVYNFTLTVASIQIPICVKVFNFTVPQDLHFYSQIDISFETVLAKYSASSVSNPYWDILERFKYWLIQHRITPKGPLWSGGLTSNGCPYINYDCTAKKWNDTYGVWGFEKNAQTYINGVGFNNGHGWPHFVAHGLTSVMKNPLFTELNSFLKKKK